MYARTHLGLIYEDYVIVPAVAGQQLPALSHHLHPDNHSSSAQRARERAASGGNVLLVVDSHPLCDCLSLRSSGWAASYSGLCPVPSHRGTGQNQQGWLCAAHCPLAQHEQPHSYQPHTYKHTAPQSYSPNKVWGNTTHLHHEGLQVPVMVEITMAEGPGPEGIPELLAHRHCLNICQPIILQSAFVPPATNNKQLVEFLPGSCSY